MTAACHRAQQRVGEVGEELSGRLVSEDEGVAEDTEKDMVAEDFGVEGAAANAEEAAGHTIDEP